jgi:peptidoglycan hydrolase-like protein with peptidoglycan-binding domain
VTTPTTTAAAPAVAAALPTTTLKPGDTGAQVRALQRALKSLGYPVGKIDGQYGPATKTAVAAFQHAAGLTEDGVVGPKTLNALIHRAGP